MQNRPTRCILHSTPESKVKEICSLPMGKHNVRIHVPSIWPGPSTKGVYKINESPYLNFEKIKYSSNNLSGRHLTDGKIDQKYKDSKGHNIIFVAPPGIHNECKQINSGSLSEHQIFGDDCQEQIDDNSSASNKGLCSDEPLSTYIDFQNKEPSGIFQN